MHIQEKIRLHRFHDTVAFNLSDTETLYLTPSLAKAFARELQRYVEDCETTPFTDSKLRSTLLTQRYAADCENTPFVECDPAA